HDLLGLFCTDCALESIRKLPRGSWLHIMESRPDSNARSSVHRKYKIYSVNGPANRADLVIIDGSNKFLGGLRLATRLDVIPPNSRAIDCTFEIRGSVLEIELVENLA